MPSGNKSPYMASLTVDTTAAGNDLFTLMSAIWTDITHKACFINIQLDTSAGGSTLFIGGSDVSSTECGVELVAGQGFQFMATDSNLYVLDQIFLLASTATVVANVVVLVR